MLSVLELFKMVAVLAFSREKSLEMFENVLQNTFLSTRYNLWKSSPQTIKLQGTSDKYGMTIYTEMLDLSQFHKERISSTGCFSFNLCLIRCNDVSRRCFVHLKRLIIFFNKHKLAKYMSMKNLEVCHNKLSSYYFLS